jgi:hypothetical protein
VSEPLASPTGKRSGVAPLVESYTTEVVADFDRASKGVNTRDLTSPWPISTETEKKEKDGALPHQ